MRVIGGQLRSRKLKTLKGQNTRPTSDKIKGAIFSSLAFDVKQDKVLDLFSGSGSIGIEALSRGFNIAYLNDKDRRAFKIIKENIKDLNLKDKAKVYNLDYKSLINKLADKLVFDLIFIDPPYNKVDANSIFKKISDANILAKEGIIVFESDNKLELAKEIENFIKYKEKNYKATTIHYYKNK